MDLELIGKWVKERIGADRYRHTLGVVESARVLAGCHGLSVVQAQTAAFVHDCARELPPDRLLKQANDFGILIGTSEQAAPVLLHAPVGAELAERELGIDDPVLLKAVRVHCTGAAGMSVLDKVLFVADMVEPGRSFTGVEEIRGMAMNDLQGAVELCLQNTICYLISIGRHVHEDTLWAWIDIRRTGGGSGHAQGG